MPLMGPQLPVGACSYPGVPRPMGTSVPRATSPWPQCPTYLCPRCPTWGQQPRGSPLTAGGQRAAPGASSCGWRGGPRGRLAAGGPGQGHLPPSEDAPGPAAGNFPRHRLFPSRGGAAMPPLLLKAQQAAHPLLFISHPLVGPQPRPQNLAKLLQRPPWPRVSPCLAHARGSSRRSGIPRSRPSPNPPPARAHLMKAGRPVPIRQGASLNREPRGLPRAPRLAPGPALAEQRAQAARGHPGTRGDAQRLPQPRQRGRHRCRVASKPCWHGDQLTSSIPCVLTQEGDKHGTPKSGRPYLQHKGLVARPAYQGWGRNLPPRRGSTRCE